VAVSILSKNPAESLADAAASIAGFAGSSNGARVLAAFLVPSPAGREQDTADRQWKKPAVR